MTLDRVKYMELEASFDSWKEYALSRNLHSAILSYLTMKPEQLYVFRRTGTQAQEFVTPQRLGRTSPRSWKHMRTSDFRCEDALFSAVSAVPGKPLLIFSPITV